jgi:hypothetical protein
MPGRFCLPCLPLQYRRRILHSVKEARECSTTKAVQELGFRSANEDSRRHRQCPLRMRHLHGRGRTNVPGLVLFHLLDRCASALPKEMVHQPNQESRSGPNPEPGSVATVAVPRMQFVPGPGTWSLPLLVQQGDQPQTHRRTSPPLVRTILL